MRYAIVERGVVQNVEFAERGYEVPGKLVIPAENSGPGWAWDGEAFSPPAPSTPSLAPLTARQLRLGLVATGVSLTAVEAAIDAIEDATDREVARVEWEYASQFERNHPLIDRVGAAVGMTSTQINDAWVAAVHL